MMEILVFGVEMMPEYYPYAVLACAVSPMDGTHGSPLSLFFHALFLDRRCLEVCILVRLSERQLEAVVVPWYRTSGVF